MSPATKSKSKDNKLAARAAKELAKASLKPTPTNNGNGVPGSAYNPLSGTFHAIETAPSAPLPSTQNNGRFRTIDENDDQSLGTSADYDSLSNNDSCSGDSEEHKEKTIITNARTEAVPGCDTDKRDKMRQKNERKHQRQKEKRAQELHERCNGYLMSRKLEALSQKIVAMGIPSERATMALILNEGRVEESVAWLFETDENGEQPNATNLEGTNLKIDITDELGQIAALEIKYQCTKQEVERAVVAWEGDLEKAEVTLKTQQTQQTGKHTAPVNDSSNKPVAPIQNPAGRATVKGAAPISVLQQGRDDRVSNSSYAKSVPTVLQPPRKVLAKQERARLQATPLSDKRRTAANSLVPPLQVAVPNVNGGCQEGKTGLQPAVMPKEPIIMMQRPQSITPKQSIPSITSPPPPPPLSTGWHPNGNPEAMLMATANGSLGHHLRSHSLTSLRAQQYYSPKSYQSPMESSAGIPGWSGVPRSSSTSRTSSIALPSSLGLFTGLGSSGSSGGISTVDWSTSGVMPRFDYTSVDWSLDPAPSMMSVPMNHMYDVGAMALTSPKVFKPSTNGGVYLGGLQDGGLVADPINAVGSTEWTSPFNGRDLFRDPRQFVTSPSP